MPNRAQAGALRGAAGLGERLRPLEPAVEQRAHPWLAPRGGEGWPDDDGREALRREGEGLHLERFLRAEVREEATLRKVEIVGQAGDGEAVEAQLAGQAHGMLQDGLTRQLSLSHTHIIVRTFVCVKREIGGGDAPRQAKGLSTVMPQSSKSSSLRVTRVRRCARAVAAISMSA